MSLVMNSFENLATIKWDLSFYQQPTSNFR